MTRLPKNLIHAVASRLVLNFAAMIFIGVTAFLVWQTNAWNSLFQFSGIAFVIGGLIISGGVVGAGCAFLHHTLATFIISHSSSKSDAIRAAMVRWTGTIILIAQLLVIYYLTAWGFENWIVNRAA